jgi:hypothetical protein
MTILMAVAALALAALGCGGSDDEESLTKAEFAKQGKAICAKEVKKLEAEIAAFNKENPKANKAEGNEFFEDKVLPHFQAEVDQLSDLPAPSGDEDEIAAMLDSLEKGIEAGDGAGAKGFLSADNEEFVKGAETAQKYGLVGCMSVL